METKILKKITHLCIGGGGMKGASIIGALDNLFNKGLLKEIEAYIGSSVGGLICFLLNIGYTIDELKDVLFNIDFSKYLDINFSSIIDKWGFDSGDELIRLLVAMIKQKDMDPKITFLELYNKTNILLVITGSELIKNEALYYNYETSPKMCVIDAIRKTISYPIVFHPLRTTKEIVVDGALFSPYPIDYFKDVKTKLGITLNHRHGINNIDSCEDYLIALFKCMQHRYENVFLQDYLEDSIVISMEEINGMDFSLDRDTKYKMYKVGYDACEEYLLTLDKSQ